MSEVDRINRKLTEAELGFEKWVEFEEYILTEFDPRWHHTETEYNAYEGWTNRWVEDDGAVIYTDEFDINQELMSAESECGEDNENCFGGEVNGQGPECFTKNDVDKYPMTTKDFLDNWNGTCQRERVRILPGSWLADVRTKGYWYQYIRVRRPLGIVNYPIIRQEVRNPRKDRFSFPRVDNLAEELLGEGSTPDDLLAVLVRKRGKKGTGILYR